MKVFTSKSYDTGNEIIGEMMGYSWFWSNNKLCYADWDGIYDVKLHEDWNKIHEIISFISELKNENFSDDIYGNVTQAFRHQQKILTNLPLNSELKSVWVKLVDFAQFYIANKVI